MKLPHFEQIQYPTLKETLDFLAGHPGACVVNAGGTVLVPNLKKRLKSPSYLVSLKDLKELSGISGEEGQVVIGALTTLKEIQDSDNIKKHYPALMKALSQVGAPVHQRMGTIGGNLCQDTRCLYYHQSEFWRSTRNPCYKLGGQICHAEKDGDRCRSVCQSDGATALIALVALIRIVSRGGERLIPLSELYTGKGEAPHALEPDEILKEILIPLPPGRTGAAFGKLRYRGAIDYPLVNAACTLTLSKDGLMDSVRLVLGALGPAPFLVRELSPFLRGKSLGEAEIERAKEMARAYALTHAVDNIGSTLAYRQKVTPALAARVLKEAYLKAGEERRVG